MTTKRLNQLKHFCTYVENGTKDAFYKSLSADLISLIDAEIARSTTEIEAPFCGTCGYKVDNCPRCGCQIGGEP